MKTLNCNFEELGDFGNHDLNTDCANAATVINIGGIISVH